MMRFLNRKQKEVSVVEIVPKLIKRRYLSSIIKELSDPREIYAVAGRYYPGGEQCLARDVAKKLGRPFLERIETALLAEYYDRFPTGRLRKLGIFPVADRDKIAYIAAVDPKIARQQLSVPDDYPIALSSWSTIKFAWETVEESYQQRQREVVELVAEVKKEQGTVQKRTAQQGSAQKIKKSEEAPIFEFAKTPCFTSSKPSLVSADTNINVSCSEISLPVMQQNAPEILSLSQQVMLIDDSNIFCSVLKRYLKSDDYQFREFSNPLQAVDSLLNKEIEPDLIICDLHMPQLSGLEVLRQIRAEESLSQIPFVLLTSDTELETKLELIEAGADAFIGKNEDPRLISVQVKSLLKRYEECLALH